MILEHKHRLASDLRWLPNLLSASRAVLAFPVGIAAANEHWVLAVWLMLVALLTDFLDGLAAKKLHAQSKLGGHIDRVADFLLAGIGTLGLIASGVLSAWILLFCIPAAAFVGYVKFLTRAGTKLYRVTSALSVVTLFSFWTLILWCLLAKAYGWSWLYPVITLILLCIAARLKRHRLRAWFGWIKAKANASRRSY